MLPFQSGVMLFGTHPTIRINILVTEFWMPFLCNAMFCGKNSENLFVDSSPVYRIISCLNQMLILWLLQCILLLKSLLIWRLLRYEVITIHLFPFCALYGSCTVNNRYKSIELKCIFMRRILYLCAIPDALISGVEQLKSTSFYGKKMTCQFKDFGYSAGTEFWRSQYCECVIFRMKF